MNPRPGEIWLADLGLAAKTRPVRLERKLGRLPGGIMEQLKEALAFALDLPRASE